MKTKGTKQGGGLALQAVGLAILAALIVLAFYIFARSNDQRIIEQNNSFIEAAAEQTADRLGDMISDCEKNSGILARMYGAVMDGPDVTAEDLRYLQDHSSFDYVEFIAPDGTDLNADGKTADLSDREYVINGLKGLRGSCVVYDSRITAETLLIFYSPLYYQDEIIGVLSCIQRGDTVRDMLSSDYFGTEGSAYLIERDGTVIISTRRSGSITNLIDYLENGRLSNVDLEAFKSAIDGTNGVDRSVFNYKGSSGEGSAYITALENSDWLLVQSFPSSVTKSMSREANAAGIGLLGMLSAVFLVYLFIIIMRNTVLRKKLVDEKQTMTSIVDATTGLFSRFALVDLDSDTYEYLENKGSGAPMSGKFTELRKYLSERYVKEDNSVDMDRVISPEYARENLTDRTKYIQHEYEIETPNGRRWENISIICIKRRKGKPVKVLYAIQDVTELKERELSIRLALKNSSEAAEAANRAKTDFLARMSHDIRTPMNAIMGMTAVAAMHLDDRERLTDCLSKITVSSRHLLALINDVLDMSKIESGKVSLNEEPFSLADMVESVVVIIKQQAKAKNQDFRVHINTVAHENVIGDLLRLRQVFVNILGNAVKFTPEGGKILFSIRELEPKIHGMASFEFVCEDNGIGMDKEFMKTIFDPFSRAKESAGVEGTGLGMPITRNIIRMMSGDITVESEPGKGSKFTVLLHLRPSGADDEDTKDLADLSILVADDDEGSCVSTCEILDNIGMRAEWVLSGEEAVEKTASAHESGNDFSAVILDWKMPGKDGVQTAREIRERVGEGVPIIILSAYDWSDVETEAREAGISAFIEKPLFRSRLVYALKSVLSSGSGAKSIVPEELGQTTFSGKRVLLVEDNELNREIATELLSYTGAEVECAVNGREAVDTLTSREPGAFDLVLMDIQMPVLDGYGAAREIRASGREDLKKLPIIAMTANAFSDDILKAQESGMNGHISKPVEVPKLLETMKKWIG